MCSRFAAECMCTRSHPSVPGCTSSGTGAPAHGSYRRCVWPYVLVVRQSVDGVAHESALKLPDRGDHPGNGARFEPDVVVETQDDLFPGPGVLVTADACPGAETDKRGRMS